MVTHKVTTHDPEPPPGSASKRHGRCGDARALRARPARPHPRNQRIRDHRVEAPYLHARARHPLGHLEPDERLGDRRAAASRVRQPLTHLAQRPWTESGPAAAALVEAHARVQQHREGPPRRDVPTARCREGRSRVDHRLGAARAVPLPGPVVGLLERDPAGEADVRGFPMTHRFSLEIAPGDGHRVLRPHRRTPAARAEAILVIAVAPPSNRLLAGAAGGARLADSSEGSRS